jgi:1-aminocyclopropane-1-carboxylate deaminase
VARIGFPGGLSLLRLDRVGGVAPGNKSFKLEPYLALARQRGVGRLVSFGGAWSNHLHALAAVGRQQGFETVGIVRGEEGLATPMLEDARRWGMRIVRVSRSEYRRRDDPDYQRVLARALAPCVLVPEGGASVEGARGCAAIADLIRAHAPGYGRVVLPVGTGTTLAGLVASLGAGYEVVGISVLKGAGDLEGRVRGLLRGLASAGHARWRIVHEFHCGGFARADPALRAFIQAFEAREGIPVEPVYTGKMLFATRQLRARGEWDDSLPTLAIHTGGLQGRRGYPWLQESAYTSPNW